eukprot:jgi/Botrbrau1/6258/Bobra.0129s0010.1
MQRTGWLLAGKISTSKMWRVCLTTSTRSCRRSSWTRLLRGSRPRFGGWRRKSRRGGDAEPCMPRLFRGLAGEIHRTRLIWCRDAGALLRLPPRLQRTPRTRSAQICLRGGAGVAHESSSSCPSSHVPRPPAPPSVSPLSSQAQRAVGLPIRTGLTLAMPTSYPPQTNRVPPPNSFSSRPAAIPPPPPGNPPPGFPTGQSGMSTRPSGFPPSGGAASRPFGPVSSFPPRPQPRPPPPVVPVAIPRHLQLFLPQEGQQPAAPVQNAVQAAAGKGDEAMAVEECTICFEEDTHNVMFYPCQCRACLCQRCMDARPSQPCLYCQQTVQFVQVV